ncbi:hypothetical protein GCM10007907_10700 [Chitinimonas prasina]|uniref:TonB C-terminal domain-containing protein n=1 Tax=Chitinimonas prasina TaxID=1434937 RepID=A0ABQ5YFZ7_9NEIS|nr:TonB family protein [Chitinimonas prasina]GLR12280.1 hypothetical protein GCM10007907_10700 [Chitinimonas prasina]
MSRSDPREEHRALSFVLAVTMHGVIAALLYFGVQWQTQPAAPVEVELWAGAQEAVREPQTKPQPKPREAAPEPEPEPTPAKPDIQLEPAKPRKKPEKPKPEPKPEPPKPVVEPRKVEPKPEKKPNKVLQELAGKLDKPPVDASVSLNALAARQQAAEAGAKASAMEAYYARVRNLIRRNMNYPDDQAGNPEAEFSVTLLPDMSVLSAELSKSSGNAAFDEAAKRAILRTSQYPTLPAGVDFSSLRKHKLKFRLRDA